MQQIRRTRALQPHTHTQNFPFPQFLIKQMCYYRQGTLVYQSAPTNLQSGSFESSGHRCLNGWVRGWVVRPRSASYQAEAPADQIRKLPENREEVDDPKTMPASQGGGAGVSAQRVRSHKRRIQREPLSPRGRHQVWD